MFSKVKRSFLNNDPKHKHAYALLSVITDKIREQGGDENNNASYFAMLMNYLNEFVSEKTKTDDNKDMEMLAGVILLLSETVPKVPGDVLSKHGKNCIEKLTLALKMLNECPGLGSAVSQRCILSLGCLLRENFEVYQTTTEAILEVAFNGNPKSRRIACNACYQCIGRHRGLKDNEPHPLSRLVVKKCIEHIKSVGLTHKCVAAFNVLRAIFLRIHSEDMQTVLELIITVITDSTIDLFVKKDVLVQTYKMFNGKPKNISNPVHELFLAAVIDPMKIPSIEDESMIVPWLAMMVESWTAFYENDVTAALTHLQNLLKNLQRALLSKNKRVAILAAEAMRHNILHECLLRNPPKEENLMLLVNIFKVQAEILGVQYNSIWDQSLIIIAKWFHLCEVTNSEPLWQVCQIILPTLETFRNNSDFGYKSQLESCFGKIIAALGPTKFLSAFPLKIDGTENKLTEQNLERSWILPTMKTMLSRNVDLSLFFTYFRPLSVKFFQRANAAQDAGQKSMFFTLFHQIWELLPSFAKRATDLNVNFTKANASDLYDILNRKQLAPQWKPVILALKYFFEKEPAYMSFYGKRYIKKLFNLHLTLYEEQNPSMKNVNRGDLQNCNLDAIEIISSTIEKQALYENFKECLAIAEKSGTQDVKARVFDIVIRLSGQLELNVKQEIYHNLISVWLANSDISSKLKKKVYLCLEKMIEKDDGFRVWFENVKLEELNKSLSTCENSSKKPRLGIICCLIEKTDDIKKYLQLVPELILSYNETNKETRERARKAVQSMERCLIFY